jgi:hypothetical protein
MRYTLCHSFILLSLYVGGSWRILRIRKAFEPGSGARRPSGGEEFCAASVSPYMTTKKNRIELAKKIIFNPKKGDAEAAIDGVSSQRERPGRSDRQKRVPRMKAGPLPSRDGAP